MPDETEEKPLTDSEIEAILAEVKDRIPAPWGKTIACDPGWYELIAKCHLELVKMDPDYQIAQIKEKWGTLRYYFMTQKDQIEEYQMWTAAQKYESLSSTVCEITGKPGVLMRKDGLIKTLNIEFVEQGWELTRPEDFM